MGRCGGLKEGGHHRKAIDVAAKKRVEKSDQRAARANAGARALTLNEILALDPDVDVYLDYDGGSGHGDAERPMCRSFFRHDRCSNRRCKFSHEHSVADALTLCSPSQVAGDVDGGAKGKGRQKKDKDLGDDHGASQSMSVPPVEKIPGFLHERDSPSKRRRRQCTAAPPTIGAAGSFEVLSESTVRVIVSFCRLDADVGRVAGSCRYLRRCLLDCEDVSRRRGIVMEARLLVRNDGLRMRAVAGRLRFAVSYAGVGGVQSACREEGKRKGPERRKGAASRKTGPTLAYDFENPHVFLAFRASYEGQCSDITSALAAVTL